MKTFRHIALAGLGAFFAFSWQVGAAESTSLSLDEYLNQVKRGHTGFRGAEEISIGTEARSKEGELLLAPTAFANLQYTRDGKPSTQPVFTWAFQDTSSLSLGVSKLTTFGLLAKLSTNLYKVDYEKPSTPYVGFYNPSTILELTQPLLANGFGRSTRANQELIESQALAASYGNRYTARTSLVDAESSFWRLATARQAVALTRENYDRAVKNFDWSARRAKLQLADKSDELQAKAQLEARKLELQRALDDEKSAALALNTNRGVDSNVVTEKLPTLTTQMVLVMAPPKRAQFRDDVKAAAQQSRVATAGAAIGIEKDRPTVDVFGQVALNGQSPEFGKAYAQSFSFVHPTTVIGLRVNAPLDLITASTARGGYTKEQAGADLNYQRKIFEQDQSWQDLSMRLDQAKHRLQLASLLEETQQAKLTHERDRYRSGRSTAFQVLSFESDYAVSELARIQVQSEVLTILTQMKLYGEAL